MTKPLFSVSHLALHSCGHHPPAWQPPPPSPRGAWSPTSFPRGVTTAFLFINPISPCYCIIAFLPSLTSKGGTRASQRTICKFPGQLALLAANTGQSIELLLGRSSAPHWGLSGPLWRRSLDRPDMPHWLAFAAFSSRRRGKFIFCLILVPRILVSVGFFLVVRYTSPNT